MAGYGATLAQIHDAGFGFIAEDAARRVLKELEKRSIPCARIVDLGCGSGILAEKLVRAGHHVTGIDQSAEMITIARRRCPQGVFRVKSHLTAGIPPCFAVTATGEIFNYRFDRKHSWDRVFAVFQRVYEALAPGGFFLFDVAEPNRTPSKGNTNRHFSGDGWSVLVTITANAERNLLTRDIVSFLRKGRLYERSEERHELALVSRTAIAQKLTEIGFQVRATSKYAKTKLPRGLAVFFAQKPK